jgi:hypothetical protein
MDALNEVRALAVRIGQGAYGARDLREAQLDLTRMWADAMLIKTTAEIAAASGASTDGSSRPGSDDAAGRVQAAAELKAETEVLGQQFSVESIDAYIRVISGVAIIPPGR